MSGKRIGKQDIIGDQGIALIHKIVADMGYVWYPTGSVEAGIDGYIEIRNNSTGEVSNQIIQVQSKATLGDFSNESPQGFDYYCNQNDLEYWLHGNAPVILIRSRPRTDEAYWVSIKDYFSDPMALKDRKIHFDKNENKFSKYSAAKLNELALPRNKGIYMPPIPKKEQVYSNLLLVERWAANIFIAATNFQRRSEIIRIFRETNTWPGMEWIIKNQSLISFNDLREEPWSTYCDPGSVEVFSSDEWAFTNDVDKKRDFVQLLNLSLQEKLAPKVRFDRVERYYYFSATRDNSPKRVRYQSIKRLGNRTVFEIYKDKKDESRISYYRHHAFYGNFYLYDNKWYLQISPHYRFTWDGKNVSMNHESLIKGIKRLERNPSILYQVIFWADYIKGVDTLFENKYPFLDFGYLQKFELSAGIDDSDWLGKEEGIEREIIESSTNGLPLFSDFSQEE